MWATKHRTNIGLLPLFLSTVLYLIKTDPSYVPVTLTGQKKIGKFKSTRQTYLTDEIK